MPSIAQHSERNVNLASNLVNYANRLVAVLVLPLHLLFLPFFKRLSVGSILDAPPKTSENKQENRPCLSSRMSRQPDFIKLDADRRTVTAWKWRNEGREENDTAAVSFALSAYVPAIASLIPEEKENEIRIRMAGCFGRTVRNEDAEERAGRTRHVLPFERNRAEGNDN